MDTRNGGHQKDDHDGDAVFEDFISKMDCNNSVPLSPSGSRSTTLNSSTASKLTSGQSIVTIVSSISNSPPGQTSVSHSDKKCYRKSKRTACGNKLYGEPSVSLSGNSVYGRHSQSQGNSLYGEPLLQTDNILYGEPLPEPGTSIVYGEPIPATGNNSLYGEPLIAAPCGISSLKTCSLPGSGFTSGSRVPSTQNQHQNASLKKQQLENNIPRNVAMSSSRGLPLLYNFKGEPFITTLHGQPTLCFVPTQMPGVQGSNSTTGPTHQYPLHQHVNIHRQALLPYKCNSCPLTFETSSEVMWHVTECHDRNIPEKHEHYKDRMNQLGYKQCPECGKFYMDDTKLRSHYYDCHRELWPESVCGICHKAYKTYTELCEHKRKANHDDTVSAQKIFLCEFCGESFESNENLQDHLKQKCEMKPNSELDISVELEVESIETVESEMACDKCGLTFKNRTSFNHHLQHGHKEERYHCEDCGKKFNHTKLLMDHQCIKNQLGNECAYCSKVFRSPSLLEQHEKAHSKEITYRCPACDFRCEEKRSFNKHAQKVHKMTLKKMFQKGTTVKSDRT